jgi:hypothetical protein
MLRNRKREPGKVVGRNARLRMSGEIAEGKGYSWFSLFFESFSHLLASTSSTSLASFFFTNELTSLIICFLSLSPPRQWLAIFFFFQIPKWVWIIFFNSLQSSDATGSIVVDMKFMLTAAVAVLTGYLIYNFIN